jgi:hypothetical protein
VRVTTSKGRFVGRLVELKGETIVLARQKEGRTETLDIYGPDVSRFEVSHQPSRKGKGARIGMLAGLGAAIAVGVFGGESCASDPGPADWSNFSRKLDSSLCIGHGEAALLSGILTVPLGALVGAAVMPGEKWRPAPVGGLAVRPVAARGGGLGVQVAISF